MNSNSQIETLVKNISEYNIKIGFYQRELNKLYSEMEKVKDELQKICPHKEIEDINYFGMSVCKQCGKEFY